MDHSAVPHVIDQERLSFEMPGKFEIMRARYYWLLLAEGHLNRRLFGDMLHRIWALPLPSG